MNKPQCRRILVPYGAYDHYNLVNGVYDDYDLVFSKQEEIALLTGVKGNDSIRNGDGIWVWGLK